MIETLLAQLRVAASVGFSLPFAQWSLDRLVQGLLDQQREFGGPDAGWQEALGGPELDDDSRQEMQVTRFRSLARRAARETAYYGRLFRDLGCDPAGLRAEDIPGLPVTTKQALRDDPDAFVASTARPYLRALTTGTTGRPTAVAFSWAELQRIAALSTLGFLVQGALTSEDVVQISTSSRAILGNLGLAVPCAAIGAGVHLGGIQAPEQSLALLAERRRLPGKKDRVSVLSIYPSYLGELVECGLAAGYRPADFGLQRIVLGGEVVTAGVKRRAMELFGPVAFLESYGMTETIPAAGSRCSQGHYHWGATEAMLEILDLKSGAPAQPGAVGTLVVTPLPPYRDTTLLLRYDTQDLVQVVPGPLTCELRQLPATGPLLGKLGLCVQHEGGWVYARQLLEALEALEEVPLPARCSIRAVPGGVAVKVVTRGEGAAVRTRVEQSLVEHGIPVTELRLAADRRELQTALPLRCDLRETSFA